MFFAGRNIPLVWRRKFETSYTTATTTVLGENVRRRLLSTKGSGSGGGFSFDDDLIGMNKRFKTTPLDVNSILRLEKPRVLITGALGQLGQGLARILRSKYGQENVIMSDIIKPPRRMWQQHSPYVYIDVLDVQCLEQTVVNYQIDWLIHFSAILSATAEQNVPLAIRINIEGMHNILEVSKQHQLRVFMPSTIGAFGPSSPRFCTPDVAIQRPRTIYGVSKVHAELLGEYYHARFGLDYRCLRFPGVISADTNPGGGTTDYAVKVYHDALNAGHHQCYLKPDTRLPMIYIDDCLRSVVEIMETPPEQLTLRTYNVSAMAFTPEEVTNSIRKHVPNMKTTYNVCPIRQSIADSWPQSLDDSTARRDWRWKHEYDLDGTSEIMLRLIGEQKKSLQHAAASVQVEQRMKSFAAAEAGIVDGAGL